MRNLIVAALVVTASGAYGQTPAPVTDFEKAEPGLAYGASDVFSLPKTILFSAGPDEIAADAEEWARRGINAFFLDFIARDWSSDIWAADNKPWTIGASDDFFRKAVKANEACAKIGSETFLKIAFDHPLEWFNDTAWQRIVHNFRQFAIFARDTRCTGIALDIEYIGDQYSFEWEGYRNAGYSRKDLVARIHDRMTTVMQVLYDEFPAMVFLTFPEEGFSLGTAIHVAWIEEAARRNAPGGVHYCVEHTYRRPNIRGMFAYSWACNQLFHRLLSRPAQKYWEEKCTFSAGVWPFGFDDKSVFDPGMPIEEWRQAVAASRMISPRYSWVYSHNARELMLGRKIGEYTGPADINAYLRVMADRAIVTTPPYGELAKDLRAWRLRDYSRELDLVPVVNFAGPADVPSLGLMAPALCNQRELEGRWKLALDYFNGGEINLHDYFGTQTHWMLIGPFPNPDGFAGHGAVYGPEKEVNVAAAYDGIGGKVAWKEYNQTGARASVDLTAVFKPAEHACAYALCNVTSPAERRVQFRLGTNDSGKLWLAGKLIFDRPGEGTAYLDRDIIPVTLAAGTTPLLIKVCNNLHNWGFVFRITEADGTVARDIAFSCR
jgi:hypothetical protein